MIELEHEHERAPAHRPLAGIAAAVVACVLLVAIVTFGRPDEPSAIRTEQQQAAPTVPTNDTTTTSMPATAAPPSSPAGAPQETEAVTAVPTTTPLALPIVTLTPPPAPPPPVTATPPAVVARPIPAAVAPSAPPGPAAFPSTVAASGHLATEAGCAAGTSAGALDAFFRDRMGPVVGHDYQHVYPLDGDRHLWLFQDTFIDHSGNATRLDQTAFAHNTAMVQQGSCFTLLHRGSAAAPQSFETGTGEQLLTRWFWPLGGETVDGVLHVFWVEMAKTADPRPPDGLGWVPARTWLATYDASTLTRLAFQPAPASGVDPVYGFAVASDDDHTYLFGNTFDQNLQRQGGYWACPCSATQMYLARVPCGRLDVEPEYHTAAGWSSDLAAAAPIVDRFHAENPMQPRLLGGRWVATTKVDGYWGDELVIDVAPSPAGPWTTVERRRLSPRGGDPLMNTYHAHLLPWLHDGSLVVSVSQNARDMLSDAWPQPARYRLQFLAAALPDPPPEATAPATSPTTTTVPDTTTSTTTTTTTTTTSTTTTTTTTTTTVPVTVAP